MRDGNAASVITANRYRLTPYLLRPTLLILLQLLSITRRHDRAQQAAADAYNCGPQLSAPRCRRSAVCMLPWAMGALEQAREAGRRPRGAATSLPSSGVSFSRALALGGDPGRPANGPWPRSVGAVILQSSWLASPTCPLAATVRKLAQKDVTARGPSCVQTRCFHRLTGCC